MSTNDYKRGLTLVELVIVLAIMMVARETSHPRWTTQLRDYR
jgi:prepilin-type N-terminal cleavage/methylation domain-containing protein